MTSAGIWIRVSTEDQARGESPAHHEARARAYATAKGWEVTTVYDLGGWSGKTVKDHPECRRMLQDIAVGRISALIFSKLARLARNTRELLDFRDYFRQHEADLVALDGEIDTSTSAGRMFYTFKAAQAEWERDEIAERVAVSVPIRAKLGKPLGGAAPYGYRWQDRKLVLDDVEAPIRKLMFELFLEYKRKKTVARLLNERGYRTRAGKAKSRLWTDTTVDRLLRDPMAKGLRRANYTRTTDSKKAWKVKPQSDWVWHNVPPIVPEPLWDACNAILSESRTKHARLPKRAKQLFAGLTVCHCGTKMYVKSNNPKYVCNRTGCKNKIPIEDLEAVFKEELRGFFVSPDAIAMHLREADGQLAEKERLIGSLRAEQTRLTADLDKIMDLYLSGELPKASVAERYLPLEARRDQIRDELPRLQGEVDLLRSSLSDSGRFLSDTRSLYEHFDELSAEEKRRVVEQVCQRIEIGTGEVIIELGFHPLPAETVANTQRTFRDSSPRGAGSGTGT
jgi:site-specific DNA recombinase